MSSGIPIGGGHGLLPFLGGSTGGGSHTYSGWTPEQLAFFEQQTEQFPDYLDLTRRIQETPNLYTEEAFRNFFERGLKPQMRESLKERLAGITEKGPRWGSFQAQQRGKAFGDYGKGLSQMKEKLFFDRLQKFSSERARRQQLELAARKAMLPQMGTKPMDTVVTPGQTGLLWS